MCSVLSFIPPLLALEGCHSQPCFVPISIFTQHSLRCRAFHMLHNDVTMSSSPGYPVHVPRVAQVNEHTLHSPASHSSHSLSCAIPTTGHSRYSPLPPNPSLSRPRPPRRRTPRACYLHSLSPLAGFMLGRCGSSHLCPLLPFVPLPYFPISQDIHSSTLRHSGDISTDPVKAPRCFRGIENPEYLLGVLTATFRWIQSTCMLRA